MSTQHASLRSTVKQTAAFVAYVARNFASFYFIVALTLLVLFLEYSATSLMIPLSSAPGTTDGAVARIWRNVLGELGLEAAPRAWLWLFFLVMIARLFFGYLQVVSTTLLGKNVHRTLSGKIFRHVVSKEPLTSIYTRTVGHYITLAGDDTYRCGTIISCFLQCIVGLCTALVALAILYQFSMPLFAAVAGFLVLCTAMISYVLRYILRMNVKSNALSRELNTAFVEALNNLRSIRALHGEEFVRASYAEQIAAYVRMLFKIEAVRSGIKAFPAILLLVVAAILLHPHSTLSLSEASLFAGTIIIVRIFVSLGQFISAGAMLLSDIRAVRDIESLIRESSDTPDTRASASGEPIDSLSLSGIDFGYGARARILTSLSFRFEKGKTYAIVGPSGSGKSTLADILLGLVRPDRGSLVINDGGLAIDAVCGRFMLVEQQPKIFSTTLRDNLLFGFQAPDERLWEALRLVDLEHTIRHFRNGLDTRLSYLGENFSGGQRQRIGIARALVRNPDVLILDEATSALDQPTRALVVGNIRRHMQAGIIVFITHDHAVAGIADEVLELHRTYTPDNPVSQHPESGAVIPATG